MPDKAEGLKVNKQISCLTISVLISVEDKCSRKAIKSSPYVLNLYRVKRFHFNNQLFALNRHRRVERLARLKVSLRSRSDRNGLISIIQCKLWL